MTADEVANAVGQKVGDRLFASMDLYIASVAEGVRGLINVPVSYSGSHVVRSLPGEPPRRETGEYLRSWGHRTTRSADTIKASAGTETRLGTWLEKGTSRMKPRQHVEVMFARVESEAVERIKSRL